jgi:hypothetical protein
MKSFTQIAIPHDDIVKGRLTMDVFAADLWQVVTGRAPLDYQDPDLFFKKTYETNGLRNILQVARGRLEGKAGDPVIQLQTPFGGGKTHTLIALFHKAKEWGAKVVVFDGAALDPRDSKPWEELERQLTGKIELTKGEISPGKDTLIRLISENTPLLILIDEILVYATKAAGIKVGDSNLAAQTRVFIQELTGAVSTIGNAMLVITLPSSILEHYDENAERMFQQMQKIVGRIERIYTPVEDEEIEHVVRARLFSKVDEKEAKGIVDSFIEYAKGEGLLSEDEVTYYRDKFLKSYPFKPEVIDTLYKKWGSFPTFQRTRGVLRLLSLVVNDLLDKNVPFIRLGDFNLKKDEIKRELIKHIGQEWDSVIYQDITSDESGAKTVDESLGSSYKPYKLGTVVSTSIFMLSFSGRGEREVSIRDVKLSTVYPEFSSTVVDTAITNLREKLFYLSDEGLFFTNQPNLNKLILSREENIPDDMLYSEEVELIKKHISSHPKIRVYIHPKFSKDIPDNPDIKLVVLDKPEPESEYLEKHGESPRVNRNTVIFLCREESHRESFAKFLKRFIALRQIEKDKDLNLTEGQRKEVKNKIKSSEQREYEELRKIYRKLFLPSKEGFERLDMGIPTVGENLLDVEVFNYLKSEGRILEKISPKVIKDKYLGDKDFVEAKKIYEAFLKTPGELRLISKESFIESIKTGVRDGLFAYGHKKDEEIECKYVEKIPTVDLADGEVIIKKEKCVEEPQVSKGGPKPAPPTPPTPPPPEPGVETISNISLKLKVPVGQISTIVRVATFLIQKFKNCDVKISIEARDGSIRTSEYEDKILEALKQANIEIEEEDRN